MVLLLSVIVCGLVWGGLAQSPCPGIFDYQNDVNGVYGIIRLIPNGPVSAVNIRVNFTIATRLLTNYVGRLEPIGSNQALQQFNQGAQLQYRVHFPVTSPLPRLTSLVVNNRELCYGPPDTPGPGQYVSTISLQHMLYQPGGSPNSVFYPQEFKNQNFGGGPVRFNEGGPVRFNEGGSVPYNTQVYTVNDRNGNTGTYTYYTFRLNSTQNNNGQFRPGQGQVFFTEQTTQPAFMQIPQNMPDYNYFSESEEAPSRPPQYYPEQTTQTPPPTRSPVFITRPPPRLPPQTPRPQTPRPTPRPTRPPPQPLPEQPPPDFNPYDTSNGQQQNTPFRLPNNGECGIIEGGNERVPLIYNGESYTRGDWPWLVAIYKKVDRQLKFVCSGTLVSHKHVITAAHCMHQKNTKTAMQDIVVKVGVFNLEDMGDDITETRSLASATIHESYNSSTLANDILLLTLNREVQFNVYIKPACLWSGSADLNQIVGASGVVAGWGRSEIDEGGHGEPRMTRIPIVSTTICRASKPEFHKLTSSTTICAGNRNGVGPCLGDSGGGLYLQESAGDRWRLRGVVSLALSAGYGDTICNLEEYVVLTDAAKYLSWIRDLMYSS